MILGSKEDRGMAYAAVISLKHTIINPNNNLRITRSSHLELLSLCSTLERLDDRSSRNIDRSVINALDAEIREAAYKLEDVLQSHVLHSHRSLLPSDSLGRNKVEQEIGSFFETVKKLEEEYIRVLDNPLPVEEEDEVLQTHDSGGNKSTAVELSDQIETITNELLDLQPGPKTVSLVGMAGIGKSHLATKIHQHPLIIQHFSFIAWVRVGPKRKMKDVMVDIVAQIEGKPRNLYVGKDINDLPVLLHNSLRGGRYLIVLDDVWSKEDIDFLKSWLPGDGDGRRILLTTRLEEVAKYDRTSIVHQMRYLNNEESWNLLWQNVFVEEKCFPPQLEKVGRKIAEKCEGLPLLILAVASILRGLEKTEEFWNKVVEEKAGTTFTKAYDQISKVLYSSYEYLQQHLKACFLYMGVFPQRFKITLPKLINLWVAEDFLELQYIEKGIASHNLEEGEYLNFLRIEDSAMKSLEKLVSNSLVIICKHSSNFTIKSCKLHSAYWHLCIKEARKNKLFHVLKTLTDGSRDYIESQRRLSIQNNILFGIKDMYDSMAATLTARSLLCTGPDHEYPVPICLNLVFLKVLEAAAIRLYEFPTEALKLVWLKYFALTHDGKLPSSISNLQQLQCLVVCYHHNIRFIRDSTRLPNEMRDEIRDVQQVWSTKLPGDSTRFSKEIWEKICDMQQVGSTRVVRGSTCLTKEIWMEIWKLLWDTQKVRETKLMRNISSFPQESWQLMWDIQEVWSTTLPEDSTCLLPKEIWEMMWEMQQMWSTKLQRDSITLLKEIWEEIWDMQQVMTTKLLSDSTFLPKEIWDMPQLRHLRIIGRNLPDPSYDKELPYLSTLHVNAHSCTYSVFRSIPRLKKLGIKIELQPDSAETLRCFKHINLLRGLRSLKCVVVNPRLRSQVVAPPQHLSNLPNTLKKLSLNGLGYGWKCMSVIGLLPELEVLKLRCSAFQGPKWETKVKEFPMLKYLLLEDMDVVRWRVDEGLCFPSLQHLIIRHCYRLKNLPGAIAALKTIEVVDCSPIVVASAKRTQQDRHPSVRVVITSSWSLRR